MLSIEGSDGTSGLISFGGTNNDGGCLDELFAYHPPSQSWTFIVPQGEKVQKKEEDAKEEKDKDTEKEKEKGNDQKNEEGLARSFASMVEYKNALYVFGGKNRFLVNNLWKFHLGKYAQTLSWNSHTSICFIHKKTLLNKGWLGIGGYLGVMILLDLHAMIYGPIPLVCFLILI